MIMVELKPDAVAVGGHVGMPPALARLYVDRSLVRATASASKPPRTVVVRDAATAASLLRLVAHPTVEQHAQSGDEGEAT